MSNVVVSSESEYTGVMTNIRDRFTRRTKDAGAGIVEYAALVILAAAILGALIASGVTTKIESKVKSKVNCLMAATCAKAGEQQK